MIFLSLTLLGALSGPPVAASHAAASLPLGPAEALGSPEALGPVALGASFDPTTAEPQRGQRNRGRAQGKKRRSGKRPLGGARAPKKSKKKAKIELEPAPKRAPQQLSLPAGEPDDQIRQWFVVADYDLNDWISYREANKSLSFDRLRFRVYDTDRDGRIRFGEFKAFHDDSVYRGGKFREPRPQAGKPKPPQRSPELLRNAYDLDLDGEIGLLELARILLDYGREDVAAETALASLDSDRNQRLGPLELVGLPGILHPIVLPVDESDPSKPERAKPQTISELFGRVSLRHEGIGAAPTPPLIVGPVPHFRRLDINDDGSVSVSDLEGLLRPLQLRIRVHSVISTLDRDGDGVLSEAEFAGSLSDYEE